MDRDQVNGMQVRLAAFVRRFQRCIKTAPSRRHFKVYVGGQVSDLPRKSVEPMALQAGVPPRTLQEFLGLHRWDEAAVRREVQQSVQRQHGDPNAIAVIDETGNRKKGDQTAGVQRQYCGASGKTDNCVITVHLGFASEDFHTLVDGDLYLPKETWCEDRQRCRAAGIPDTVVYRPKWRIALDLLERSRANGLVFRYLSADEGYGNKPGFRAGVAAMGLTYMVEVPCSTRGWRKRPRVLLPGASGGGRPRQHPAVAPEAKPARRVDDWWRRGGPRWEAFHVKDTEKGPLVWEARATRFVPSEEGLPGADGWLVVARHVLTGEVKYFFSNAPAETPMEVLLHIAFSRWSIERDFEDAKGQIGFDHFEVRQYRSLMRHIVLSLVSLLFLMEQTKRLRGKKSVVEPAPGAVGGGDAAGPGHALAGAEAAFGEGARHDFVSPGSPAPGRAHPPTPTPQTTPRTRLLDITSPQMLRAFVAL
jgi:SRSO17 transposase